MLPREYTLSQYDSSPPLTACKIVVILINSSFVEQVEEYTCLNTDSSGKSYRADISYLPWTPKFTGKSYRADISYLPWTPKFTGKSYGADISDLPWTSKFTCKSYGADISYLPWTPKFTGKSYGADISYLPWTPKFTGDSEARVAQSLDLLVVFCWPLIATLTIVLYVI
jgi:hypothetical protein